MASTILYKFRSAPHFEALLLPGSAPRLLDVKRAIVKEKKLDASAGLEFDFSIRNADTNFEYADESMLLPRGARVEVRRLPAARGHGFLARMARMDAGMSGTPQPAGAMGLENATPSSFYTMNSHGDDQDEYVSSSAKQQLEQNISSITIHDEEQELAALQTVIEAANADLSAGGRPGGGFQSRGHGRGGGNNSNYQGRSFHQRPNADPELREHEKKLLPKKRVIGVPRMFLRVAPATNGSKVLGDGADAAATREAPMLQPNVLGFEELMTRGGGQSENASGTKQDLDYALKLTATTIPEELQCGICHGVVKNAMLLAWDPEGRTACENCMHGALAQNGFRCPLTGMEGVSPDDLHPNYALRKVAERFVKNAMKKMEEIEERQLDDDVTPQDSGSKANAGTALLEGDRDDTGVIVNKRQEGWRRKAGDEPFGGDDDDFGGDVFAVEAERKMDEAEDRPQQQQHHPSEDKMQLKQADDVADAPKAEENALTGEQGSSNQSFKTVTSDTRNHNNLYNKIKRDSHVVAAPHNDDRSDIPQDRSRREMQRKRGPPVGYVIGPAGRAAVHATTQSAPPRGTGGDSFHSHPGRTERYEGYNRVGGSGRCYPAGGDQGQPYNGGDRGPDGVAHRGHGRSFLDRAPGRQVGSRFPGSFGGRQYNDRQPQSGGRWGGSRYTPLQSDRAHDDHSIRDDVSSLSSTKGAEDMEESARKRQKRTSPMDENRFDSRNKFVLQFAANMDETC